MIAANKLYNAMVPIANDDAQLRTWLRTNGPQPALDVDRVYLGEAPKTVVPPLGGAPVAVPLSLVLFGEPNEGKATTFGTQGARGRLRIYCNVPRALRHAGTSSVAEHLDRLFNDTTMGTIGMTVYFGEIEIVNSFADPDGMSYRGVFEFRFEACAS